MSVHGNGYVLLTIFKMVSIYTSTRIQKKVVLDKRRIKEL